MSNIIQIKRGLETNLPISANNGELLFTTDSHKLFVGNGVSIDEIDYQKKDVELTAIAGLTSAANKGIYFTGSGTAATYDLSATALTLLDDTSTSAMRTTLGLAINTDVQAHDTDLDTIAGLTATTDNFIVSVASAWASRTPAQVRTTLALVIGTNVQAWDADLDAIAALAGTSGFLTKTASNTWSLDTSTYLTTSSASSTYLPLVGATYVTTTGNGLALTTSTLSTGSLVSLASTGTAAGSNTQTVLNVATSGANGISTQSTWGLDVANTHTGTSSTNIGARFSASGGTNNYALIVPSGGGSVGIGTSTPTTPLHIVGSTGTLATFSDGTVTGLIGTGTSKLFFGSSTNTSVSIRVNGNDIFVVGGTSFRPLNTNAYDIGTSSLGFKDAFITGSMILGASSGSPVASSILDIQSTTKGILITRMTTTQMNAISSPATGLLIFNTTTNSLWRYTGSAWIDNSSSAISGTATNDNATAGNIGEEVVAIQSTYTNYTTTATYQNITSITLTAGDWDISAMFTYSANAATITAAGNAIFVISTTTASAAGAVEGRNISYIAQAALLGTSFFSDAIPSYRVSISGSTTYYLNTQAAFTLGNPQYTGGIRARRMR